MSTEGREIKDLLFSKNNYHLPIDQISARILNITLSIYRRDKVDSLYPEP